MLLRFVLVVAVIGLGLSLPSRREAAMWRHSAQSWVNAKLADWDSRSPVEERTFVFAADASEPGPVLRGGPGVDDHAFDAVLDDMSTRLEGDRTGLAARGPSGTVALEAAPLPISEDLALAVPTVPAPAGVGEFEVHDLRADSSEKAGPLVEDLTTLEATAPGGDRDFEAVVEQMADAFSSDSARMALRAEAARGGPWEVGEDLYPGTAYALNRASEGVAQESSSLATAPSPSDRLTNAVRLTREAVFAWARLLHGPAVVTIAD